MKQNIAYIISTGILAITWTFLGVWFATNLFSSRNTTAIITWNAFLAAWTLFTILFLRTIIRRQIK